MRNERQRLRILEILLPALVLIGIVSLYLYVSSRMRFDYPELYPRDGVLDLREISLEDGVYDMVNTWDYYPGALYRPEAFADPDTAPEKSVDAPLDSEKGTWRVVILAKPRTYISIAQFSIDYSTRIFVNGKEERNIGFVSDDPAQAVHKNRYITLPMYSGEEGRIELVYQYSNYMHNDAGFLQKTHISTPENIDEFVRGITLYSLFTACGLLFLAFYFLLFAAWQRNREFAALAFCCVIVALRNQFFLTEHFLLPSFDFELEYRFFILIVSSIPVSVGFLIAAYYPAFGVKKYVIPFTALYAALTAAHFLLPLRDLVLLCHVAYYLCAGFLLLAIIVLFRFFLRSRKLSALDLLRMAALAVLIVMLIREGINSDKSSYAAHYGLSPAGMLMCILILSVTTNIGLQRQAVQLAEEQRKNELLEQVNTMNKDFLQTIAHELKTPLTVISGYAQLIQLQMGRNELSDQTPERLKTIRSEADRLGDIVTRLVDYTYGQTKNAELSSVDPRELLKSAATIMKPVCAKRGNALITENGCGSQIHGNYELLLQVLINLIVNASRHTENGTITVAVSETAKTAVFVVKDTGSGISEEAAAHLFERGYSGDHSSGLGLSICKETVQLHGGELSLIHTGKDGSAFRFTIPLEAAK